MNFECTIELWCSHFGKLVGAQGSFKVGFLCLTGHVLGMFFVEQEEAFMLDA